MALCRARIVSFQGMGVIVKLAVVAHDATQSLVSLPMTFPSDIMIFFFPYCFRYHKKT